MGRKEHFLKCTRSNHQEEGLIISLVWRSGCWTCRCEEKGLAPRSSTLSPEGCRRGEAPGAGSTNNATPMWRHKFDDLPRTRSNIHEPTTEILPIHTIHTNPYTYLIHYIYMRINWTFQAYNLTLFQNSKNRCYPHGKYNSSGYINISNTPTKDLIKILYCNIFIEALVIIWLLL